MNIWFEKISEKNIDSFSDYFIFFQKPKFHGLKKCEDIYISSKFTF